MLDKKQSNAVPAGHTSDDTSLMRYQRANSLITVSRQYRASSIVTVCSGSKMTSINVIRVIMKNGNSFVSRKKNRFWRLFGRGLTACIRYGTQGCTRRSIMSRIAERQQKPILKTVAAASPTMPARMQSVHLQSAAKTGCSVSR